MHVRRARDWKICTDQANEGLAANWQSGVPRQAVAAPVPGIIQQVFPDYHGLAWYWSELAPIPVSPGHRVLIRFESVDYAAKVWLNGHEIGSHEGDGVPFELDATEFFEPGQSNLLAVRVINPTDEPIDGLVLSEIPHSNKALPGKFRPGSGYNVGGITGEVVVHVGPAARLLDVVVRSDLGTGIISVDATVSDATVSGPAVPGPEAPGSPMVSVLVSEDRTGLHVASARHPVEAAGRPGAHPRARVELQLPLGEVRPWDLDDPFLYRVRVRLEAADGGTTEDEKYVRTGFRELRVRDGWFELNGRRIYLRSTHTGNHYPIGQEAPHRAAFVRQDLVYAKAAGFNTVRFIAGVAREDQLDFCDELGLMVYEETRSAWLLGDSPRMAEHFDRSNDEMIRRDRNHPSVVIWGLLNETYDGPIFRHAVGYLARLRELDATRLVLLGSGRWDGDLAVGSVSNPGEPNWQHQWGAEQPGAPRVEVGWAHDVDRGAYVPGAGDLHLYPHLPESAAAKQLLSTMGRGSNPVFLSEYGVGSAFDAVTALAEASCDLASFGSGATHLVEPPDIAYIRSMAERFVSDWERFGMDEVYCFPEEALADSQLNQSLHRAVTFDLIRANGKIAGYNLTGMLDHALTGEGPWTYWRRWKPAAMETTAEGWSPLRWCLGVNPTVSFPGGDVEIDLSLANEDVLPPGRYEAKVAVVGPSGWRWQRTVDLQIGDGRGPLALPVLAEHLTLDGGPGRYRCAASLGTAAAPAAGRTTVEVLARLTPLAPRRRAGALGLGEAAQRWLSEHGLDAVVDGQVGSDLDLLLVGHAGELSADEWRAVATAVDRGATAVLLTPWELIVPGESSASLPIGKSISCTRFHDWLYHKDCFARRADFVDGLPGPGLMDWRYYREVLPRHLLQGDAEDVAAFATAIGFPCPGGYASGLLVATFTQGRGCIVVNTFDLLDNLGSLAVADRLMLNLLRYATR
ncbi:MAG TPA: glycoside hydrolase family 2 TIM barrel-domain containing protein [Acidimicrobiales bacterium]|nr:glycoside hydrolase family 2 TIM barrel-domain containing protein [Acidimicrobiales bacterium]